MDEDLTPCGRCLRTAVPGGIPSSVSWSPAFGQHLCPGCRQVRTDAELAGRQPPVYVAYAERGA